VVLAALAATTMGVGLFAAMVGAWPVMPFAGLEIALVFFAFHVLAAHDQDFEHLEIGGSEVSVEARNARSFTRFTVNAAWARLVVKESGERCTLGLAYAGRTVPLGRLMSDEGRRDLARKLRGRIAVTAR
jgi:uncharacterized membrane protein